MSGFDWSACNVLVTGASGFIGSHLVMALKARGAHVVGLVTDKRMAHQVFRADVYDGIDLWHGDLTDAELVRTAVSRSRIHVCFHLAAISQVFEAATNPIGTYRTNIEGTWNVLEACRRQETLRAFVGASSDKVYGDHDGEPYVEDMALRAVNTYDVSKACADMLVRSYAGQYDLPSLVTRFANQYGPGDFNWGRLVPNTIRRIKAGQRPSVHEGALEFLRDYLYVEDAVAGLLLVAERAQELKGRAFNVAADERYTVEQVIRTISQEMGVPYDVEVRPRAKNFREIPMQRVDASALKALGWAPRVSFAEGLKRTVAWYAKACEELGKGGLAGLR